MELFVLAYTYAVPVLAIIAACQIPAQLIVKMTPTPRDDAAVAGFYRVVEMIAGVVTPKAKQ